MKRYSDYTDEELANLSGEEISKLIDIEVAFAGIKMVPKPMPLDLITESIQPTEIAYEVKGVLVPTIEAAKIIQNTIILCSNYHGSDWDHRYTQERDDSQITIQQYYTKEAARSIQPKADADKAAKKEFEAANKLYCEYEQQIDAFRQEVLDAVSQARRVVYARNEATRAYQHYLELTDGDKVIAERFFRDAFSGQFDLLNHVLGDPLPESVMSEEDNDENS